MLYKKILDKLENQVRIIDSPRRFSRNEVEKLIEISILERKIEDFSSVPGFNDGIVENLQKELDEKMKFFNYG